MTPDTPGSAPVPVRSSGRSRGHAAPASRVLAVGLSLAATCTIITALAIEQPSEVSTSVDPSAAQPVAIDPTSGVPTISVVAVPAGDGSVGVGSPAPVAVQAASAPSNWTPPPTPQAVSGPGPASAPAPAPSVAPTPTTPRVVTPPTTVARTRAS